MGHVELDFKISGTADMAATGAGPMNGYCAMLKREKMKRVLAILKSRLFWIASLSFVDRLILGGGFLLRFARVRNDFPKCSVQGLALGPDMVCCPESGETEIMSDLKHILCVDASEQLNQMVW